MTATEPASLDALLRTATPVEAEPFDLGALLTVSHAEVLAKHWWQSRGMSYNSPDTCSCGARTFPEPGDEDVSERRACAFAAHQAEMLLGTRDTIAREINAERVRTEDARRWVDRLQGENAELTDVIAQVVVILNEALTWHNSETDNTACAVQDALALLAGDES